MKARKKLPNTVNNNDHVIMLLLMKPPPFLFSTSTVDLKFESSNKINRQR